MSLVDVAARAGLTAPSVYGGVDRKRFIIETNGAGVALLDYDNDGWLDALVLSGTRLAEPARADVAWPRGQAPTNRLYRNQRDGTFVDVTDRAGLRRTAWSSSVCAGDYDNDGWLDLFVTAYGTNVLYRNRQGRFEDVTASAGLPTTGTRWGSGCTFVDYDRDGKADLFVANYLRFDLATAAEPGAGANCLWKGIPVNCGPKGLPTDTNLLFHNEGDGRFRDVSEASGVARVTGRYPMTATAADFDGDGWTRHLRRLRLDGVHPLPERPRRDLHRRRRRERRGLQRDGQRAGGDGSRPRRLRLRRPARPAQDAFRRRHPRPLPQPRPRPVRRRGHRRRPRPCRTATWSGERACPTSTTTARPDVVYVTGNVYPEIERLLPHYPHRGPRIVFRNRGGVVRGSDGAERARSAPGRTPAAAPPSATSTTTATSTSSS